MIKHALLCVCILTTSTASTARDFEPCELDPGRKMSTTETERMSGRLALVLAEQFEREAKWCRQLSHYFNEMRLTHDGHEDLAHYTKWAAVYTQRHSDFVTRGHKYATVAHETALCYDPESIQLSASLLMRLQLFRNTALAENAK